MHKPLSAALLVLSLSAAPTAPAGDFFVNGQAGRIDLDNEGLADQEASLLQASAGYRWGIGMAQVGVEGGVGRLGGRDAVARPMDTRHRLESRYAFAGLNARVKPPLVPVYGIGRAGYVGMRQSVDSADPALDTSPVTGRSSFERTDGGTYVGLGVGTTILPMLDVGLMVTQYRYAPVRYDAARDEYALSDDKRGARSVSLTAEYRF